MPAESETLPETVAVYWKVPAREPLGVNVAVCPLTCTVPGMSPPPTVSVRVKLVGFRVVLPIASEKVAVTEEFNAMPVAALGGDVLEIVGGVVSEVDPVVKFQAYAVTKELPARSFAAVDTVAVNWVLRARLSDGTKDAKLAAA